LCIQEDLLVSCIPTSLVNEMKKDLQQNMRQPKLSLFHDLYVQHHSNVRSAPLGGWLAGWLDGWMDGWMEG
jgi:hypothetical protein